MSGLELLLLGLLILITAAYVTYSSYRELHR